MNPPATPLRIGLVRRGYSASGGAESYVARFADALRESGHEPVLFCGPDWRAIDWPHGEKRVLSGASPVAFADALNSARRDDCDLIFSLERVWSCDCYRAGDGVHRSWLERRARYEPRWKSALRSINPKHRQLLRLEESLFGGGGRSVIANSRLVRDEICRFFGFPAEQIHVVYNGLPPRPEFPPEVRDEMRARLGVSPKDCMLLFAGSGWERKGLRFAIEAVNRLKENAQLHFVVAGRGSPKRYRSTSRVRFLGPVRDMPHLFEAADVFILPTLYDPFSNACLEAFASGLPVITTAQNGFSEIIRPGEEGEVIEQPEAIVALSEAIAKWMDPARTAKIREQLRQRARQFSAATNVDQTMKVLMSGEQRSARRFPLS